MHYYASRMRVHCLYVTSIDIITRKEQWDVAKIEIDIMNIYNHKIYSTIFLSTWYVKISFQS